MVLKQTSDLYSIYFEVLQCNVAVLEDTANRCVKSVNPIHCVGGILSIAGQSALPMGTWIRIVEGLR